MPALVGRDRRGRHAVRRVDGVAQIDGHRLGIEVVGELSGDMGNLDVVDAVVAQHLLGDLGTREAACEGNFRVLSEDRLQAGLHAESDDSDQDDEHEHAQRSSRIVSRLLGGGGVVAGLKQDGEKR